MPSTTDTTTLICLFHSDDQARAALEDLNNQGVPQASIQTIRGANAAGSDSSALQSLGVPSRDIDHLQGGLDQGGTLIAVSAAPEHVGTVENIFSDHHASQIDEQDLTDNAIAPLAGVPLAAAAGTTTAEETTIPIVEEEMQVGKRTVDQGGVRVFRKVVSVPVEASVNLREEHVVVQRNAVDRPATAADLAQGAQTIELTETAEEAVIAKNARVVEEVLIGKQVGERTEHIQDTVRRTEVEFEELTPANVTTSTDRTL